MRVFLEQKNLSLDVDLPSSLPSLRADREVLRRILVNILDPAIGLKIKSLEGWFLSAADSDFDLYEPE